MTGIDDSGPLHVFIVAGEASGDVLGAKLMSALKAKHPSVRFTGVGGAGMIENGLESLFPMSDIAVMGIFPVLKRLPLLLNRIALVAKACISSRPDVFVAIDSPDFTHRVARRVRSAAPEIPIIDYVSPTVWAWRSGRAKAMRGYFNHVLALLPFEPAAYKRLDGPPCSYIGHPLIERFDVLRPHTEAEIRARAEGRNILLLPGSRTSEIHRLLSIFGEAAQIISTRFPDAVFQLPVVPHLAQPIREAVSSWSFPVEIIEGDAAKFAVYRSARAALAASGTVTLELALSGIPTVAAYRVSLLEEYLVRIVSQVDTVILPSIIMGEKIMPELLQGEASPENLAGAMAPLIAGGPEREAQLQKFEQLDRLMEVQGNSPSAAAADIVCEYAVKNRKQ